jgi:hypothetical protein
MLAAARYLADFARLAATKRKQEHDDLDALRELEQRRLDLPAGLELEWLGVSGYRVRYEGYDLLIDPYISRVPLRAVLRRAPALPDPSLLDRHLRSDIRAVGSIRAPTSADRCGGSASRSGE